MDQEELDIRRIKEWCNSAHVNDPDAEQAFNNGRGIFDVEPDGVKLRAFFKKHPELKPNVKLDEFGAHPGLSGLIDNRPIYFAFKDAGQRK